jgi:signal transduction histidine kinase
MDDPSSRILDELPLGVWVGGAPEARSLYSNRAFQEILGMGPDRDSRLPDIPRTYRVFDRAGNPYPVEKLPFSRVLATGASVTVEDMVIHRADGTRLPIRAFGHPLRDAEGHITSVIVAFIDISREAQAEAERDNIEKRLKVAVDHAPIVVFSIEKDGTITLSEGAGLVRLGLKSGELVGQSAFEIYRDHPTIPGLIQRALSGESFHCLVELGDAVLDGWMTPLHDREGNVSGLLGVAHDSSELRQLQAAAIQNDRVMAMGTLAASVAHEINNPLTYVLHHLTNLERALDAHLGALEALGPPALAALAAAAQLRDDLTPAHQGVQRIATVVRDLRSFSRADEGALEPIDVRRVVDSVLKLVRKDLEARARLVLDLQPVPPVLASETRLAQVLINLLINARQSLVQDRARNHQSMIALAIRSEPPRAVIEVEDTGPGVPASERDRVFEPFVTHKPRGEGTGLGLFVCRNIVRGLGGEISVHDRPGGGAVFRVELPTTEPAAARPSGERAPAPAPADGAARVLVIDDEPQVARALCAQLRRAGIQAEQVGDADSAATMLLGDAPFDLVYCDLMMKGLTGMDLAARLAEAAPHRLAQVVFMTGGAFTPRAADFLEANPDCFVEKPFDIVSETRRRLSSR